MIGKFKVYDQEYASTSKHGWYEAMKIESKQWAVLEFYPDGSADYRTFENSKAEALATIKFITAKVPTQAPYYIDHGTKYYNKEAY